MIRRNRAFTLTEVLVVFLLLSLALSLVVPFSYKAYNQMRFSRSVSEIEGLMRQKKLSALMKEEDLPLLITWKGKMIFNEEEISSLKLIFYSNGTVWPRGQLILQQDEYVKTLEIA